MTHTTAVAALAALAAIAAIACTGSDPAQPDDAASNSNDQMTTTEYREWCLRLDAERDRADSNAQTVGDFRQIAERQKRDYERVADRAPEWVRASHSRATEWLAAYIDFLDDYDREVGIVAAVADGGGSFYSDNPAPENWCPQPSAAEQQTNTPAQQSASTTASYTAVSAGAA